MSRPTAQTLRASAVDDPDGPHRRSVAQPGCDCRHADDGAGEKRDAAVASAAEVRVMATFVDPLRRAGRVARRCEALVCGDVRMTYAELLARCRRLVGGLARLGTHRGDRVAVLAQNSIPYVELYCSIPASGRVQVPLNTRWAEPELAFALEDSGASVLFTDRDPGALGTLVERVVRTRSRRVRGPPRRVRRGGLRRDA